jgi:hypothetical protein
MDYTTLTRVKLEANINETNDDNRLEAIITSASRAIDRKVTGVKNSDSDDYFTLEDVTDETLTARIDSNGNIIAYPHKVQVNSVSAMSWKLKPQDPWQAISTGVIDASGLKVEAFTGLSNQPSRVFVKISYNGGLADTPNELPDDFVEIATLLTIRYWKEDQSGLTDSIGIAELGQLIYTKALPARFVDMLQFYMRVVPWQAI